MIPLNATSAPLQAFADELVRCGTQHAVTSPGSRNAPLIIALAEAEGLTTHSVLDERSAGFVALGMAKASKRPVVVTCTSGTAAANLLPAVVEAHEARVPLMVLTADRPPELRDTGAGQAIDQLKLYGGAVKWFVEVGNHQPSRATAIHHRALACRARATAAGGRPGPVHLNFPLREPLSPVREELDPADWEGRPDGRAWIAVHESSRGAGVEVLEELAGLIASAPRGALVCGGGADPVHEAVPRLAAAAGWPILADPLSGLRCGPHDRSHVVAHYDVLLRDERFTRHNDPKLVVRMGDTPTSKPLRAWLSHARQVVIDPHALWHEPTRAAETMVVADPLSTCDALAALLEGGRAQADLNWLASWREADALVAPVLDAGPDPFEPKAYAALAKCLPDGALVWVSSSMPVRDVEAFFPQREGAIRFLANRGANGIDGVPSSALGAALATAGPAYLLTGELALLHDMGGLMAARQAGDPLTILCVNNGGGGIFDFLPLAEHADPQIFEEHIATPAGIDLAKVAAMLELPHSLATTSEEVREAVERGGLVEVRTERARNVGLHRDVYAGVSKALRAAGL